MALPGPLSDERELLLAWLQFLREAVLRKAEDLDEDQVRWRPDAKLITIAGIVNHLAHVSGAGSTGRCEASRSPGARRSSTCPGTDRSPMWRRLIEAGGPAPTRSCVVPIWPTPAATRSIPDINLRWVLLHLIEETARHAGHADATRELLDGTTGV
jgi:hypothetical protein